MVMKETKVVVFKTVLFLAMFACFSLQILDSFKEFFARKTAVSESTILAEPEPLPPFSICIDPPFNSTKMKTELGLPTDFFSFVPR